MGNATLDIEEVSGITIDGNIKLIRICLAVSGATLMAVVMDWRSESVSVCAVSLGEIVLVAFFCTTTPMREYVRAS